MKSYQKTKYQRYSKSVKKYIIIKPMQNKDISVSKNSLLRLQFNFFIYHKLDQNSALESNFQYIQIISGICLAQIISSFNGKKRQLQHWNDLQYIIKRARSINKQYQQLTQKQSIKYVCQLMRVQQLPSKYYNNLMKEFLDNYKTQMLCLMPVYYHFFKMAADKYELIKEGLTYQMSDVHRTIQRTEKYCQTNYSSEKNID